MDVQDLNDIANDIAVSRIEMSALEKELEEWLKATPRYQEFMGKITEAKLRKDELSKKLLDAMRESNLKSWKTEQASFSRAIRKSVTFDPIIKKQIEQKLKAGEEVENWELNEKEYISIRLTK
jgi:hypothetical protein